MGATPYGRVSDDGRGCLHGCDDTRVFARVC
jgi:hypothetical protein